MGYIQERDWGVQQKKTLRGEWLGGVVVLGFLGLVVASLIFG